MRIRQSFKCNLTCTTYASMKMRWKMRRGKEGGEGGGGGVEQPPSAWRMGRQAGRGVGRYLHRQLLLLLVLLSPGLIRHLLLMVKPHKVNPSPKKAKHLGRTQRNLAPTEQPVGLALSKAGGCWWVPLPLASWAVSCSVVPRPAVHGHQHSSYTPS